MIPSVPHEWLCSISDPDRLREPRGAIGSGGSVGQGAPDRPEDSAALIRRAPERTPALGSLDSTGGRPYPWHGFPPAGTASFSSARLPEPLPPLPEPRLAEKLASSLSCTILARAARPLAVRAGFSACGSSARCGGRPGRLRERRGAMGRGGSVGQGAPARPEDSAALIRAGRPGCLAAKPITPLFSFVDAK
jgi:hypothetical protein